MPISGHVLAFFAAIFMIAQGAMMSPVSSRPGAPSAVSEGVNGQADQGELARLFADLKSASCHTRPGPDASNGGTGDGGSGESDCQECKLRFEKIVPEPPEGYWLCEAMPSGWVLEPRDQRQGRLLYVRPSSRGPPSVA